MKSSIAAAALLLILVSCQKEYRLPTTTTVPSHQTVQLSEEPAPALLGYDAQWIDNSTFASLEFAPEKGDTTVILPDTMQIDSTPPGEVQYPYGWGVVAFLTTCYSPVDTPRVREVVFHLTHSEGVTFDSAKLYINGYKVHKEAITGDTLRFTARASYPLLPEYRDPYEHKWGFALKIKADGPVGGWYKADLIAFRCIMKTPVQGQMVTTHALQPGLTCIFYRAG